MSKEIESFLTYLALEKKYASHTLTAYKNDLTTFSEFCSEESEDIHLSRVDYSQIRFWIVSLVNQGKSNRTINRKISSLNTFYKYLQKINTIEVNPLKNHKSLKIEKKIQVPFSEKEIAEVFSILNKNDDFESIRNKLIVELLYSTGIRRQELINLKQTDVNLSNGEIKVLGKRNKERIIPLLSQVQSSLYIYMKNAA